MSVWLACVLIGVLGAAESVVHLMRIRAATGTALASAGWAGAIALARVLSIGVVALGAQEAAGLLGMALVYPAVVFGVTAALQRWLNGRDRVALGPLVREMEARAVRHPRHDCTTKGRA